MAGQKRGIDSTKLLSDTDAASPNVSESPKHHTEENCPGHKRKKANETCHDTAVQHDPLSTNVQNAHLIGPSILKSQGIFSISEVLTGRLLGEVQAQVKKNTNEVLSMFMLRQAMGQDKQFKEICCRDGGRYDIRHRMAEKPIARLAQYGPWVPAVKKILGSDFAMLFCGVVLAVGGTDALGAHQAWHTDGGHLFESATATLPCHCLNVFVPLVDISACNGGTQFVLGSHKDPTSTSAVCLVCKAGTAIVFDYRIVHRGSANRSSEDRPVLYFTYAKPWFKDTKNHRATDSILVTQGK